jgi:hypothetical protein
MTIEPTKSITVDHAQSLTVNVVVLSVHVTGYRLWTRPDAATPWIAAGSGTTEDDVVDSHDLGTVAPGSSMVYWLGCGGPANSKYKVQLVFIQNGNIVNNGVIPEEHDTDANGAGEMQRKVVFP